MKILFKDDNGLEYSEDNIYQSLLDVGADECEFLFLHSDIKFGNIVYGGGGTFDRRSYLTALYNVISRLNVKLIVPTFTYSFCNHENYDVKKSRTSMGALNEFIRTQPNRYRTLDPLLSLSVPEILKEYFVDISDRSLGKNSGLDKIHKLDGVKFLFFGTRLKDVFTYLHYVECIRNVPYQFDMRFNGTITDADGNSFEKTQIIRTKCTGVNLREDGHFEDYLTEHGFLKTVKLGNSSVSAISEIDAFREINNMLDEDVYYFLEEKPKILENKYTYDYTKERVTHC